jgi:hypothetical protein
MLIIPPPKPVKKQPKIRPPAVVPARPGAPVMLVSATYNSEELNLILEFDRAIDMSGFDPSQVTVRDGPNNGRMYTAVSPGQLDPTTIAVSLTDAGPFVGEDVTLWATATTGIVAVDDGETWPGVSGFVL